MCVWKDLKRYSFSSCIARGNMLRSRHCVYVCALGGRAHTCFYPTKGTRDPGLIDAAHTMCHLASRGLWMRCNLLHLVKHLAPPTRNPRQRYYRPWDPRGASERKTTVRWRKRRKQEGRTRDTGETQKSNLQRRRGVNDGGGEFKGRRQTCTYV